MKVKVLRSKVEPYPRECVDECVDLNLDLLAAMGKPRSKKVAAVVARKKKSKEANNELKNNPFEVRVNRKKHEVLGQKIKSSRGHPGVARSRAIQKVCQ